MTISETNLKLLKSERMTDFADGGGKMTSNEVVDGQVNNLFNDISQLDRTYGRVSLRKAYATIETANTDTYLGAHIILTDPPDDPHVNVTLFTTGSWTDERDVARNRIESYSIPGPESPWILYGDHVVGQKLLMFFSRSNTINLTTPSSDAILEVGDVMVMSVEKTGFTPDYQYVRIRKIISRVTQQFTDGGGAFFKDVLTVEIANALRYAFKGATPYRQTLPRNAPESSPTLLRATSVADAAAYYGVKKITQPLAINDMTIDIGSPYSALVPSAQAEIPLLDVNANMLRPHHVQSGAGTITKTVSITSSTGPDYPSSVYLGRGFLPGSLSLSLAGAAYKDNGSGAIVTSGGTVGSWGGIADYASGRISLTCTSAYGASTVIATALPAAAVYDNAATHAIPITINNRAFNFVNTLTPKPSPGSLIIDYKALDKWYRLYDDGLGHISGATSGIGAGTVNYATGSVLVTLAALPDVDSSVIYAWATPLDYTIQTYVMRQPEPYISMTLANIPVAPGTLSITWTNAGVKTATAGINGNITGDATGRIIYSNGKITFKPNTIPTSGTVFTVNYSQNLDKSDVFFVTGDSFGNVNFTLTQTPVKAGSVKFAYSVTRTAPNYFVGLGYATYTRTIEVHDNGTGGLVNDEGGTVAGSINYATGQILADLTATYPVNFWTGTNAKHGAVWTLAVYDDILIPDTLLTAHYSLDSDTPAAKTEDISLTTLTVDLSTTTSEALVSGSLEFSFAGATFIDRSGVLYRNHDGLTDSATASGTIDYTTGIATLTQWPGGSPVLTLTSAVSIKGLSAVISVAGRTPGAPLATGQFQLNCTGSDGTFINASADNNGNIVHEWVTGHVDWLSGVFNLEFGKMVADASLSADIKTNSGWYNAANVVGGNIWAPFLVKPETIKFNAVLVSYIPLDADILGVETVRLPQDGRVPVYRVGNVAVVHNTLTLTLPNPAVAGSTHNCSRTLLSYAKLFDANGLVVPTARYTTDLDAGTVTLANPLDLAGYVQPLKIEHRIEDMALVTDVQITGQVQFMKPVRHAYPANTSFLSSALVIGDLQARVTHVFDQQTWTSVFSDTLIGSAATASFNDVLYPLTVTNAGAIQERWAIVFTGATAFRCYGEYSGLVADGTTGAVFSPLNPVTSVPYFTINQLGWGTGWPAGSVLRFNTEAANYPLWLARTTLQSDPTVYSDNFKLQIRGDAN